MRRATLALLLSLCSCRDGRPDLVAAAADAGAVLEWRTFDPNACALQRGCIGASGDRALLHYRFALSNGGAGAVSLPADPSSCSGGSQLLRWKLSTKGGEQVRSGTAELPAQELAPGATVDMPGSGACTWADVTGVEAGEYQLEVTVNPDGKLGESRSDNDTVTLPVTLPSAMCRGKTCGQSCCAPHSECAPGGNGCTLPDLTVDQQMLKSTIAWSVESFPANDCAIDEGCVVGRGDRKLLRFTTSTPNVGAADFYIGNPKGNPNALFAQCHGHYHYHQYSDYRLVTADGTTVATGRKQAFCAFDHTKVDAGAGNGKYHCEDQGITPGWTDIYESHLDCQWIDVTDVPPGPYTLEVEVNPARLIAESDYANNVARVPVNVPAGDGCVPLPEVCANGQDEDCDGTADDGCNPLSYNESCAAVHFLDGPGEYTAAITPTTKPDFSTGCGGAGGDLVFHFSLLVPELVYLSTYGSDLDTVISVRDGKCSDPETACVDDACGVKQGHLAKVMSPGAHYVVVKAKNPGDVGRVKLTYQRSTCIGARELMGPSTVTGDTSSAADNFLLACGAHGGHGRGAGDELWYLTSCPGQSALEVSTCGTAFDTALSVKQGSCRGRDLACNDNASCGAGSTLNVPLTKPGLWFVVVDGVGPEAKGPYMLKATW